MNPLAQERKNALYQEERTQLWFREVGSETVYF